MLPYAHKRGQDLPIPGFSGWSYHQHYSHPAKRNTPQEYLHILPARLLVAAHFVLQQFSIFAYESWPTAEWHAKGMQGIHLCLVQKRAAPATHPGIVRDWLAVKHVYIQYH